VDVSNGLEVGLQVPQQPDHLDIAVRLGFKLAAGSDPAEVTIYIELEQIGGCIPGTASLLRRDTGKPRRGEIKPVDEHLDKPNWVLRADIVVQ
jgi:hypothetical protein